MNGENDSGKNKSAQDFGLFVAVAVAFAALWRSYIQPTFVHFWHIHKLQVLTVTFTVLLSAMVIVAARLWNRYVDWCAEKAITSKDGTAVYLGRDKNNSDIYLKQAFRGMHWLVIGTTGSGKTVSVLMPAIIQDIKNGCGILIIDGKSDSSFLEQLYAWVDLYQRTSDFRLFSLVHEKQSATFNPLLGGSPIEVVERVFSSFKFDNEYYRAVQFKIFLKLVTLIMKQGRVPTLGLVHCLLTNVDDLKVWLDYCDDKALKDELTALANEPVQDRMKKVSGLDASLTHFSSDNHAILFNQTNPLIQFDDVLLRNRICYFQLPTMYYPYLAEVTGKLVLQSFQSAVAKRHLGLSQKPGFFSCYLDDFQDYIYPGFAALLNKSRSANVGVVFSHQALGDLDKVGASFRNTVLTNTNIKVVMRNMDPDTCDYFSRSFGTETVEKVTERRKKWMFTHQTTGEGSVRDAEKFLVHPQQIKELGQGEGFVSIPHVRGTKVIKVHFKPEQELKPVDIPIVAKEVLDLDSEAIPPKGKTVVKHDIEQEGETK